MDLTASNFRPPCWPADQACPNQRDLVSPEGIRMSPMRLQGLAWRQDAEIRLAHVRARNATAKAGCLPRIIL